MRKPKSFEGRQPNVEGETPFPATDSPEEVAFDDLVKKPPKIQRNTHTAKKEGGFPKMATPEQIENRENNTTPPFPKLKPPDIVAFHDDVDEAIDSIQKDAA